jgi:hypothetical protein
MMTTPNHPYHDIPGGKNGHRVSQVVMVYAKPNGWC